MRMSGSAFSDSLAQIRAILGPEGVRSEEDGEPLLVDQLGRYRGRAALIASPANTAELAQVVGVCAQAGIGIVPQGGNTGYCGGATPDENGTQILVTLARMNRIRELDSVNFTATVEAGVLLADLQRAAAAADRFFPLSLGSEGSCQIGGNLSTNAGGTAVLRYGSAGEQVLGLEVVLADGQVWNGLRKLRKDNGGYDLKRMFLGAEGTLGIVTAAVLKLYPAPRQTQTAWLAVADPAAACALLAKARELCGDSVVSFEYVPRYALDLVLAHIPGTRDPLEKRYAHYVLLELSSSSVAAAERAANTAKEVAAGADLFEQLGALYAAGAEAGQILDGAIAHSGAQRMDLWRLRESVPAAQRHAGGSLKHDVSVPISAVPEFLAQGIAAAKRVAPAAQPCAYGHIGDGNLHFNFQPPEGVALADFAGRDGARISAEIHAIALALGGSLFAEHGVGQAKAELLASTADPLTIALMRRLKKSLDPSGIMNPGKILK